MARAATWMKDSKMLVGLSARPEIGREAQYSIHLVG